jgi:glucokinase
MQAALQAHPDPTLLAQAGGDVQQVDARLAFEAARQGHPLAQQVLAAVARDFCLGLAAVGRMIAPDLIVLGGGVMRHYDLFLPYIQDTMQMLQVMMPGPLVQVAPAALGENAGLYGAAYAGMRQRE